MSLTVPAVSSFSTVSSLSRVSLPRVDQGPGVVTAKDNTPEQPPTEFVVKYDSSRQEVIFEEPVSPVRVGDWVIITTASGTSQICI